MEETFPTGCRVNSNYELIASWGRWQLRTRGLRLSGTHIRHTLFSELTTRPWPICQNILALAISHADKKASRFWTGPVLYWAAYAFALTYIIFLVWREQTNSFAIVFLKMDRHTGVNRLIHGPKHHKDIQSHSVYIYIHIYIFIYIYIYIMQFQFQHPCLLEPQGKISKVGSRLDGVRIIHKLEARAS